ncbi:MAG: hypothetical protein M0Z70_01195 [Nitrospiraceae bacterium]|jgi:hypothetical protein|nr:hypothetical protein [Nitrospirota bacterium]MDA8337899.1 hypothetical protein [Nitrospiraceae bacterium]
MKSKENIIWIVIVLLIGIYLFPSIKNRLAFAGSRPAAHELAPGFSLYDLSGKNVRQPKNCINEQFMDPLTAWKIAGLPKPDEAIVNVIEYGQTPT